jgi:hypothetical protein
MNPAMVYYYSPYYPFLMPVDPNLLGPAAGQPFPFMGYPYHPPGATPSPGPVRSSVIHPENPSVSSTNISEPPRDNNIKTSYDNVDNNHNSDDNNINHNHDNQDNNNQVLPANVAIKKEEGAAPPSEPPPTPGKAPRWRLLNQPNPTQRKSYNYENRFVLPNPLIIFPIQDVKYERPLNIDRGEVCVEMLDESGNVLPFLAMKRGEGLTVPLDNKLQAKFHLKLLEGSYRSLFRLRFNIKYREKGDPTWLTEELLTDPFRIISKEK